MSNETREKAQRKRSQQMGHDSKRSQVWSYGGGRQTAAIAVMIAKGILPKPDVALIADTSREMPSTWDYLHNVIQPYLKPHGVEIRIVSHEWSRVDLYTSGKLAIPAYTETGRFPTYCSGEWKRDAIQRWLRQAEYKQCDVWIGYSLDEAHRCSEQRKKWIRHVYPLIDHNITARMCMKIVEAAGLPEPPKSRCWMCPHQNQKEWGEVYSDPELWGKAVELDEQIREADELGALYLHSKRIPLSQINPHQDEADSMPLFRGCQGVGCFT